jgi:hypothetical protein
MRREVMNGKELSEVGESRSEARGIQGARFVGNSAQAQVHDGKKKRWRSER